MSPASPVAYPESTGQESPVLLTGITQYKNLSQAVALFMGRSLAVVATICMALAAFAGQQVRLIPKFATGETFRYQIETTTSTSGNTTGPIANPGGVTQLSQSIRLLVRLDVLHANSESARNSASAVRLRATYEKSQAISRANAYDPDTPSLDDPYNRLEGHSVEFTIQPGGGIADITGLDEVFPNRSEVDPILSWAKGFSSGAGTPQKGIAIGQKWSSEHPLTGMPLSDLIWRSDSTYLRNETCGSSESAKVAASKLAGAVGTCAVVLTRFSILHHGSPHSNATPPDYAREGLRTSGTWDASGESLDSISLATGLLVRSTQTGTQDVDYEVTSATTGSSIHQVSHVTTQSLITLVPAPPSQTAVQP